jgi:hypothetical protein
MTPHTSTLRHRTGIIRPCDVRTRYEPHAEYTVRPPSEGKQRKSERKAAALATTSSYLSFEVRGISHVLAAARLRC